MKKSHLITIYLIIIALIVGIIISREEWLQSKQKSSPSPSPIVTNTVTPITLSDTSHDDLIIVSEPTPNTNIDSPITIKGKARGSWYFEASFPVIIEDANGKILAQAPAQAKGEWMTNDFVPFEVSLLFQKPTTTSGNIILKKDNPSGLPEHDDQIIIPVLFFAAGVGR